jgi:hypothetical protein
MCLVLRASLKRRVPLRAWCFVRRASLNKMCLVPRASLKNEVEQCLVKANVLRASLKTSVAQRTKH